MHLLYVIDSLGPGGAERSLAELAPRFVREGIKLDVALLHDRPGIQASLSESGADLFSLSGPGGRIGWVRRARTLMVRRRPDLIHTTLFEADVAGRLAGWTARVPVVSSLVSEAYGDEQLGDPRLRRWKVRGAQLLDALTARLVRRFHAVTGHVADVMAGRLHISRSLIEVIPRGRDIERLGHRSPERGAEARAQIGLDLDAPMILAVARQERQKGLDVLLVAFREVVRRAPHARLVIAGREGNETLTLRELATRLGLERFVQFLGARDDVADLLSAADVFAFPSRWEGLPGAVLEAMALEAPIVASDLPPVRELVGADDLALLVPVDRPSALSDALLTALGDRETARERAHAARARFLERYTMDRVADQMIAFYDRALSRA